MPIDLSRVLAVIPARAGSRRLPNKNLRELDGRPLFLHSVEHAITAGIIAVAVSSDSDAILEIAAKNYALPVKRPEELSQGATPPIWNVRHALRMVREKMGPDFDPEFVVYLQPTSPLRSPDDILSALRVAENTGADSVVTVRSPREELYHLGHAGRLRHLSMTELGAVFTPNGAVYVITTKHLDAGGDWWDGIIEGHIMPESRSLDIDWHSEFEEAERMMAAHRQGAK